MKTDWKIFISSGPLDKDWLVAEIFFKDEQCADVIEEGNAIILYNKLEDQSWRFDLQEFIDIINHAQETLKSNPE